MALSRFRFDCDGVTIEGEGVVTIQGGPPADPAQVIDEFLAAVDSEELERLALEHQESEGGYGSLTPSVIAVLRRQVSGHA